MKNSIVAKALAVLLITASISQQTFGMQKLNDIKQWYNNHPKCKKAASVVATVAPVIIIPALFAYTHCTLKEVSANAYYTYHVVDYSNMYFKTAVALGTLAGAASGYITHNYPEIVTSVIGTGTIATALASGIYALGSFGKYMGAYIALNRR
jgi:hypothetical protein